MSSESCYENFRTVLTLNLCTVTQDPHLLKDLIEMVDITMNDFEITRKSMDIIPASGIPEVVNYYLASKALSGLSQKTLKQYFGLTSSVDSFKVWMSPFGSFAPDV